MRPRATERLTLSTYSDGSGGGGNRNGQKTRRTRCYHLEYHSAGCTYLRIGQRTACECDPCVLTQVPDVLHHVPQQFSRAERFRSGVQEEWVQIPEGRRNL